MKVKYLIVTYILVHVLTSCTGQEKEFVVLGEEKFKTIIWHTPKQVTYFTYKTKVLKDGTIKKGEFLMAPGHLVGLGYRYHFDEESRLAEAFGYFDGDTIPTHVNLYKYLGDGKVRYERKQGPPPYPQSGSKAANDFYVDSLDSKGKRKSRKEYWGFFDKDTGKIVSVLNDIFIYTYDDHGTLIEEINEGYDFDEPNNEINFKVHLDNTEVTRFFAEYINGRLYRYGKEPPYSVFTYDAEGNKIKEEIEKYGHYTEYYSNGIVKKMYFGDDSYQEQNEEGYVTKSVVDRNTIYEAKYDQFDEYENWTRVIVYKNGEPSEYGERKIIYYEK